MSNCYCPERYYTDDEQSLTWREMVTAAAQIVAPDCSIYRAELLFALDAYGGETRREGDLPVDEASRDAFTKALKRRTAGFGRRR